MPVRKRNQVRNHSAAQSTRRRCVTLRSSNSPSSPFTSLRIIFPPHHDRLASRAALQPRPHRLSWGAHSLPLCHPRNSPAPAGSRPVKAASHPPGTRPVAPLQPANSFYLLENKPSTWKQSGRSTPIFSPRESSIGRLKACFCQTNPNSPANRQTIRRTLAKPYMAKGPTSACAT